MAETEKGRDVETELVRKAGEGDGEAFGALVESHWGLVLTIARARLHDPRGAEELAQEVFVRAFLHLHSLRHPDLFTLWLVRITRNTAADWNRRARRHSSVVKMVAWDDVSPSYSDPRDSDVRDRLDEERVRYRLEEAIRELPESLREVVLLHYRENLSKSEIARLLNLYPSSVGRQLDKAAKLLQERLGGVVPRLPKDAAADAKRGRAKVAGLVASVAAMSQTSRAALLAVAGKTLSISAGIVSLQYIFSLLGGNTMIVIPTVVLVAGVTLLSGVDLPGRHFSGNAVQLAMQQRPASEQGDKSQVRGAAGLQETSQVTTPGSSPVQSFSPLRRSTATGKQAIKSGAPNRPSASEEVSGGVRPAKIMTSGRERSFLAEVPQAHIGRESLRGRVVDDLGQPIAGALVWAQVFSPHPAPFQRGVTKVSDQHGEFVLDRLTTGAVVTMIARSPGRVGRVVQTSIPRDQVQLGIAEHGGTIIGTVVSEIGQPVPKASVALSLRVPVRLPGLRDAIPTTVPYRSDQTSTPITADEQGVFRAENLPSGIYRISAGLSGSKLQKPASLDDPSELISVQEKETVSGIVVIAERPGE